MMLLYLQAMFELTRSEWHRQNDPYISALIIKGQRLEMDVTGLVEDERKKRETTGFIQSTFQSLSGFGIVLQFNAQLKLFDGVFRPTGNVTGLYSDSISGTVSSSTSIP